MEPGRTPVQQGVDGEPGRHRSRRRPATTLGPDVGGDHEPGNSDRHPRRIGGGQCRHAGAPGQHPPGCGGPAPRDEGGESRRQRDVGGRPGSRMGAGERRRDACTEADRRDRPRIDRRDPVATDPGRAAKRGRHGSAVQRRRPRPPRPARGANRPFPSRRRRPTWRATSPGGRRPSTPPAPRRTTGAAR